MRTIALVFLCLGAGCATTSNKFTSEKELEKIATRPVPETPSRRIANVAEWELVGPLPDKVEHTQLADASPAFTQLVLKNAGNRFQLTQDLTCIATQYARFELVNDGVPGVLLRAFIEARCGSPSNAVRTWDLYGDVPDDVSDEKLLEQWGPRFVKGLSQVPNGAFAGIAMQRGNGKVRVVLTWAQDEARFEPVSIFPEGDVVRVRGTLLQQAEEVWGHINQGDDASAPCVKNPKVQLPQFELACPVRPGRSHDWLGVWVREPGRFLGNSIFSTVVFSSGQATSKFVRPNIGIARDGTPQAFLEALNEQRAKLGRAPLVMSTPQTEQARSLVAPYAAAQHQGDSTTLDRIAMGLIAGWRVEGPVTEGHFTSNQLPVEATSELLSAMLELPGGRSDLLGKDTRVLALGQLERGGVVDSLICTYALLAEPELTEARQQALIDALNAERKRRGLPAAQWVRLPSKTADQVAAEVRSGSMDPSDGLSRLMDDTVQVTQKGVRGWHFTAHSLDEVKWPDEVLLKPNLQVLMTVAPWKSKDFPWTQYVFMVVLLEGASTSQA